MRVLENGSMTTETGPIPWDAAYDYASKALGMRRTACMWFADVILALDAKMREHKTEEANKVRRRQERARKRKVGGLDKFRKQFGGRR